MLRRSRKAGRAQELEGGGNEEVREQEREERSS